MPWDLVEESKRLIGIRSAIPSGNRAVVEFLAPFCLRIGFHLFFQGPSNGEGAEEVNLLASSLPDGPADLCPRGLLFVTHLDTVPPGDLSLWTETGGDPYAATLCGDRIYGLGSADTKLDFLCKLKAIETVGLKNLKLPFCLVGTYGEERGLSGMRRLRESGLIHPRWALVGEPSEMVPVNAHKGILYMRAVFCCPMDSSDLPPSPSLLRRGREGEVVFRGRAAHGSTPHLGENAIEKAIGWLFEEQKKRPNLQLAKIEGGTVHNIVPEKCVVAVAPGRVECPRIRFLKYFWKLVQLTDQRLGAERDPRFDPPMTVRNIGIIRGDEKRVEVEFDFRLIPKTDGNELFQIFQGLSRVPDARVEVISSNRPMETPEDSETARRVVKSLQEVGLEAKFQAKAGNTEGAIVNLMGAEAVVIGPGRSAGNIHRPNEYNEISQLKKAIEFYAAFLRQFC